MARLISILIGLTFTLTNSIPVLTYAADDRKTIPIGSGTSLGSPKPDQPTLPKRRTAAEEAALRDRIRELNLDIDCKYGPITVRIPSGRLAQIFYQNEHELSRAEIWQLILQEPDDPNTAPYRVMLDAETEEECE